MIPEMRQLLESEFFGGALVSRPRQTARRLVRTKSFLWQNLWLH